MGEGRCPDPGNALPCFHKKSTSQQNPASRQQTGPAPDRWIFDRKLTGRSQPKARLSRIPAGNPSFRVRVPNVLADLPFPFAVPGPHGHVLPLLFDQLPVRCLVGLLVGAGGVAEVPALRYLGQDGLPGNRSCRVVESQHPELLHRRKTHDDHVVLGIDDGVLGIVRH